MFLTSQTHWKDKQSQTTSYVPNVYYVTATTTKLLSALSEVCHSTKWKRQSRLERVQRIKSFVANVSQHVHTLKSMGYKWTQCTLTLLLLQVQTMPKKCISVAILWQRKLLHKQKLNQIQKISKPLRKRCMVTCGIKSVTSTGCTRTLWLLNQ